MNECIKKLINYHDEIIKAIKEKSRLIELKKIKKPIWYPLYKELLEVSETRVLVSNDKKLYFEFLYDNSYDGYESYMLGSKDIEELLKVE